MKNNPWFVIPKPNANAKLRLICLSYAGGSASTYQDWAGNLGRNIELIAVQLPGRSNRITETALDDMADLVDQLSQQLIPLLDKPYVLIGHSLGSQVGFELLHHLMQFKKPLPLHFIASGRRGPSVIRQSKKIDAMNDEEFMDYIRELKGTPETVLNNPEIMALLLPMLRADFKLAFEYQYKKRALLPCNITVFKGESDPTTSMDDMLGWQLDFCATIAMKEFSGGHFFIEESEKSVVSEIKILLLAELKTLRQLQLA